MILEWKIKFVIALQIVICKNLKCVLCTACRNGEIRQYAAAWVKGTCCGLASPQTCVRLWVLPHGKAVKEPESDWRKSWRKGGLRCVLQGKAWAEQAEAAGLCPAAPWGGEESGRWQGSSGLAWRNASSPPGWASTGTGLWEGAGARGAQDSALISSTK